MELVGRSEGEQKAYLEDWKAGEETGIDARLNALMDIKDRAGVVTLLQVKDRWAPTLIPYDPNPCLT